MDGHSVRSRPKALELGTGLGIEHPYGPDNRDTASWTVRKWSIFLIRSPLPFQTSNAAMALHGGVRH